MTTLINRSWPQLVPTRRLDGRKSTQKSTDAKTIRVGLLGCGTVGREVAAQLIALGERRVKVGHVHIELTRILVRDSTRDRGLDRALLVTEFAEILAAKPDAIIEAIGGLERAGAFVEAALRKGIPVITANKTLIAHEGERLRAIAERHDTSLFCEACVGGAVPMLASLKQLRGDRIRSIRGIVNGTCNDILSRMTTERLTFDESLREAVRAGLAEPDPTADISGRDSAEKLCVLAAATGFGGITPDRVETTGIDSITPVDIEAARSHGYVIKLIAELANKDGITQLHVGPALVPRRDWLAKTNGSQNVIVVDSELAGTLVLQGAGAGPKPTASAILGDLRRAISRDNGTIGSTIASTFRAAVATEMPRPRFARLAHLRDRTTPEGMLNAFAAHGVEIRHIHVQADTVEVFTGAVCKTVLKNACRSIDGHARTFVADVME